MRADLGWAIAEPAGLRLPRSLPCGLPFTIDAGGRRRRFPVLLTMCHMGVCSIMAYAVSKMGITPKHQMKSTAQLYKVCRCITPL